MPPARAESHPTRPARLKRMKPLSTGHRLARAVWGVAWVCLFRPSPRPLHGWRRMLLALFGASLHRTARIYPRARIWAPWNLTMHEHACLADNVDCYCVDEIEIGAHATVSQYSYLCGATHDFDDVAHPLVPKPIRIGRRAWVAADVFIGPGVTIGEGTVVGARSAVFGDLPPWMVATGSPARPTRPRGIGPADFGEEAAAPPRDARDEAGDDAGTNQDHTSTTRATWGAAS